MDLNASVENELKSIELTFKEYYKKSISDYKCIEEVLLDVLKNDLAMMETEIEQYNTPHFTEKSKEIMNNLTGDIPIKISNVGVKGILLHEKIKNQKKELMNEAENLLIKFKAKVHQDSQLCDECPLKKENIPT